MVLPSGILRYVSCGSSVPLTQLLPRGEGSNTQSECVILSHRIVVFFFSLAEELPDVVAVHQLEVVPGPEQGVCLRVVILNT
jgi:hypothetical protein